MVNFIIYSRETTWNCTKWGPYSSLSRILGLLAASLTCGRTSGPPFPMPCSGQPSPARRETGSRTVLASVQIAPRTETCEWRWVWLKPHYLLGFTVESSFQGFFWWCRNSSIHSMAETPNMNSHQSTYYCRSWSIHSTSSCIALPSRSPAWNLTVAAERPWSCKRDHLKVLDSGGRVTAMVVGKLGLSQNLT